MVKEYLYKTNISKNLRKAKESSRNNFNSTSCNNCSFVDISRNNYKFGI